MLIEIHNSIFVKTAPSHTPLLFDTHLAATLACGINLMLWIVLEWWIWGFVALSNIFFALGLIKVIAAIVMLRLSPHSSRRA